MLGVKTHIKDGLKLIHASEEFTAVCRRCFGVYQYLQRKLRHFDKLAIGDDDVQDQKGVLFQKVFCAEGLQRLSRCLCRAIKFASSQDLKLEMERVSNSISDQFLFSCLQVLLYGEILPLLETKTLLHKKCDELVSRMITFNYAKELGRIKYIHACRLFQNILPKINKSSKVCLNVAGSHSK